MRNLAAALHCTGCRVDPRNRRLGNGRLRRSRIVGLGNSRMPDEKNGYCDERPTSDTVRHTDSSVASTRHAGKSLTRKVRLGDRNANKVSSTHYLDHFGA
jgi:hypothetical protein